ncbi:hypothetical protein OKW21_002602 [Catalinimonas alkaloidigena]|uniref:hypothetical protein n=1 Tax=Catalinimonas alkaloidigena TaxID=1075417 RepID=UPI002405AF29|nr:hypothetical protein [Catalinimonas alkaloidigena]MDF9797339.1 hypothetical protein [Catalinimonas alkaloidigena]
MGWLRKHGILSWRNPQTAILRFKETPTQQNKRLERALAEEQDPHKMIDIYDQEEGTPICKTRTHKLIFLSH